MHCSSRTVHCALYTVHCTLYTLHWTVYTSHYRGYTIHCTLYTVNCKLYTVHCRLYTVHRTLYTVHLTLCHCTLYILFIVILHGTLYTVCTALYAVHCIMLLVHSTYSRTQLVVMILPHFITWKTLSWQTQKYTKILQCSGLSRSNYFASFLQFITLQYMQFHLTFSALPHIRAHFIRLPSQQNIPFSRHVWAGKWRILLLNHTDNVPNILRRMWQHKKSMIFKYKRILS